jgi:ABC-type lipoprotein export system ATPase subunit
MKYASEKTIIMITHHQELSKQFLHILNLPDRM